MNTVQAFPFFGNDESSTRTQWHSEPYEETPVLSPEINRMLSAAVVSASFRRLLLRDPVTALKRGYNGESFEMKAEELAQIVSIKAESHAEFAAELIDRLWFGRGDDSGSRANKDRCGPAQHPGMEPALVAVGSAASMQVRLIGHRH